MPATKKKSGKKVAKRKRASSKNSAAKRKRKSAIKARPRRVSTGRSKGGPQVGSGRPAFKPTDDDRRRVSILASLVPQELLAKIVLKPENGEPITDKTLRRHFRAELDDAKERIDGLVGESVVMRALDLNHAQGFQSAKLYLTTRAGWTETTRLEVGGKAGVLVAPATVVSVEAWLAKVSKRNSGKKEPGLEES